MKSKKKFNKKIKDGGNDDEKICKDLTLLVDNLKLTLEISSFTINMDVLKLNDKINKISNLLLTNIDKILIYLRKKIKHKDIHKKLDKILEDLNKLIIELEKYNSNSFVKRFVVYIEDNKKSLIKFSESLYFSNPPIMIIRQKSYEDDPDYEDNMIKKFYHRKTPTKTRIISKKGDKIFEIEDLK